MASGCLEFLAKSLSVLRPRWSHATTATSPEATAAKGLELKPNTTKTHEGGLYCGLFLGRMPRHPSRNLKEAKAKLVSATRGASGCWMLRVRRPELPLTVHGSYFRTL